MATATIRVIGTVPRVKQAPKLQIITNADHPTDKKVVTFPYGPTNIVFDALSNTYDTINRPGRPPLFVMTGKALPTVAFTLTIAYLDNRSIIQALNYIERIAASTDHVSFNFGNTLYGYWRCSACTVTEKLFDTSNNPIQATVDLTFTRVSDASTNVGPASGGVKAKPKKQAPAKTKTTKTKAVAVYIVRSGDTLWSIALRHYGDPKKWTMIADYNHLPNPNYIKIGQRLKLP